MPEQERITEEQAAEALHQLTANASESEDDREPAVAILPSHDPEPPAESEAASAETDTEATTEEVPAETDDVASLKARLAEKETKEKESEERIRAIQDRYAVNDRIRQERFLKKSTAADRARQILEKVRTDPGLTTEDVERALQELGGAMNPASPSYTPPPVHNRPEPSEEQAIIMNNFLNEQGMTAAEADAFGQWVQTQGPTKIPASEQAIAGESLDGFLRLAHGRWRASVQESGTKRQDAVEAVKSVQRTQRQAAKAAASAPAAPRKQPASPRTTVDTKKFTKDDVAALLRQSVEQYH